MEQNKQYVVFEYTFDEDRGQNNCYGLGYLWGKDEEKPRGMIISANSLDAFQEDARDLLDEFFEVHFVLFLHSISLIHV